MTTKNFNRFDRRAVRAVQAYINRYGLDIDIETPADDALAHACFGPRQRTDADRVVAFADGVVWGKPNPEDMKDGQIVSIDHIGRHTVIAAGPYNKQPGTMPLRHVLVKCSDGKFAVTTQIAGWNELNESKYFKSDELVKATEAFAHKISSSAFYLESLYRDGQPEVI